MPFYPKYFKIKKSVSIFAQQKPQEAENVNLE